MSAGPRLPAGEEAARIRAAALEAVKAVPGAVLGEADLAEIIRQASAGPRDAAARDSLAANLAVGIATATRDQPRNAFDGKPAADAKSGASGWAAGLSGGLGFGGIAKTRGAYGRGSTDDARGSSSIDYGAIAASFGVDRNGALSGFTAQMFNSQFKPLGYTEPTARGVAAILGKREGLSGAALIARTKEVGRDTKDRLGLDINSYARDVAAIGKLNTEDAIHYRGMLDDAAALWKSGDRAGAQRAVAEARKFQKEKLERMKKSTPDIVPSAKRIYRGLDTNVLRAAPGLGAAMGDAARQQASGATPTTGSATRSVQSLVAAGTEQGFFDDAPSARASASVRHVPPAAAVKPSGKKADGTAAAKGKAAKPAAPGSS